MPFKDAVDISKKNEFFGIFAHEKEHFSNHHDHIIQICHYACYGLITYGVYKKMSKFKINNDTQWFKNLSNNLTKKYTTLEENYYSQEKKQKKISKIFYGVALGYTSITLGSIILSNWVTSQTTNVIGNLTWANYFERSADSFTHKNSIIEKRLLLGLIGYFKNGLMSSDNQVKLENSFKYFFDAPHPKTVDRITKLTERLNFLE